MKKLIIILFILISSVGYGQQKSWIFLDTPPTSVGIPRFDVSFNVNIDTVYMTLRGTNIYKAYKGLSGTYKFFSFPSSIFRGAYYEYNGYESGISFIRNDTLYNYGGGQHISYGGAFWWNTDLALANYTFDVNTNTLAQPTGFVGGWYPTYSAVGTPIIYRDSLFMFVDGGTDSTANIFLNKYSFLSNTWTGYSTAISEFGALLNRTGMPIIGGGFTIADTLYVISTYKAARISAIFYDSTTTVWKRNPSTYIWSAIRTFNRAGYIYDVQSRGDSVYFLLGGTDSSQSDAGVWRFDGNTFVQMPKPPSLYSVLGFYKDVGSAMFQAVGNTTIADSNKLYYYDGDSWDSGQSFAFIPNTITRSGNGTIFVTQRTTFPRIGVGASPNPSIRSSSDGWIAYDTTYKLIEIIEPTVGYYALGDSIKVKWKSTIVGDSVGISINYTGVDNFVSATSGVDSIYITLDTLSNSAKVKVFDYAINDSVYSQTFIIKNPVTLEIDTLLYHPGSPANVDIVTLYRGLDSLQDYIGADSSTTILMGARSVINDNTFRIDTTNYVLNYNITNPYIRVQEVRDTVIYGLNIKYYNAQGVVYNMRYGTNWKLSGGGAVWQRDISAGWVAAVSWQNGVSTLYLDADTLKLFYTELNYTWEDRQASNWTWWYPMPSDDYSQSMFSPPGAGISYNGRTYFFTYDATKYKDYQLWMRDDVNNISYELLGTGGYPDGNTWIYVVGVGILGSRLIIVGIRQYSAGSGAAATAYMYSTLPYPPDLSSPPLFDIKPLSVQLNSYRTYFRGIDPKIKK